VPVPEPVEQVSLALLRRGGRVLLCHRGPHRRWYPGCWDAPGGHLEAGETPQQALVRELAEELGVVVAPPPALPVLVREHPDWVLRAWVLDDWAGEPANRAPDEHDALAWVDARGAAELVLADDYLRELIALALP
jgi:mutator protein MutT